MNEVFLSGVVCDQPILMNHMNGTTQLSLNLSVAHKAKAGMKQEIYRVNAWGAVGIWGNANIRHGMEITVHGYLTQRFVDPYGLRVEVCAEEMYAGRMVSPATPPPRYENEQPPTRPPQTYGAPYPSGVPHQANSAHPTSVPPVPDLPPNIE
jgi:single-stranded DNA-binding protein